MTQAFRTGNLELDRHIESLVGRLERFSELQEQISQAGATGSALEGLVQVGVGPTGNLLSVTIDPRAMRSGSELVGEAIMEAYRTAVAETTERVNGLLADLMPAGLPFGGQVTGQTGPTVIGPDGQPADPQAAIRAALEQLRRR
jgi:DNA-binding protein YbaB